METSKRILVVDDDPSLRWLLQELLEEEAYKVDLTTDGVDALTHLEPPCRLYDVILPDLMMPRMDGLELVREMQQRKAGGLPSIIALSADASALRQAGCLGVGNCLCKPFDLDAVLALVSALSGAE